jgi:hypothetical protein
VAPLSLPGRAACLVVLGFRRATRLSRVGAVTRDGRWIVRETVEVRRHFAGDEAATAVIMCMSKVLRGPQIRAVTGLTQRQLATTVERIRRYARRGTPSPKKDDDHA